MNDCSYKGAIDLLGAAKVCQLATPLTINQDVSCFDVSVNHVVYMQVLYPFEDLFSVDSDQLLIHRIGLIDPFQRPARDELKENVQVIFVLVGPQIFHDVPMIQGPKQLDLMLKCLDFL